MHNGRLIISDISMAHSASPGHIIYHKRGLPWL